MNDLSPDRVKAPLKALGKAAARPSRAPTPALFELTSLLLRVLEIATLVGTALLFAELLVDDVSQEVAGRYVTAVLLGAVFYAGLTEVTGVYDVDVRFSVRRAWGRLLTAWLATSMFLLTLGFLTKTSDDFSRLWGGAWFVGGGVALCAVRAGYTWWLRGMKRRGVFNQRVAIFGAASQGTRLAKYIQGNEKLTIDIVGFFDDRPESRLDDRRDGVPMLGNLDQLVGMIRTGAIDQVIVALPWSAEMRLQEIVAKLALTPVRIRLAPDLASFAFAQRPLVLLGDLPVMTLFERPISGFDQLIKKVEDVLLGSIITILALPILAIAALAIKLTSPGPVFFRQPREGFNNRQFSIWKFRTMHHGTSQIDHIAQAKRDDPRVTRVGAILRRTSIDELPQLFNVLSGEMSLVGPRPHAASTRAGDRMFGDVVATYAARPKVKPGITGWAQVCGWRGETDTEEKIVKRLEHDLFYIENWSVSFDMYILVRTAVTVAFSRAAY